MVLAMNLHFPSAIFESDCLDFVDACKGNKFKDVIKGILNEIEVFKSNFLHCEITWVSREGNGVAHPIADLMMNDGLQVNWNAFPPAILRVELVKDKQQLLE